MRGADGYEFDCTAEPDVNGTISACTSLGSASIMYERLQFMTALPKRVGDQLMLNATGQNVTIGGFHQGPANLGGYQNRQGSYLTIMSPDGLSFGIINSMRARKEPTRPPFH